VHFIHCRWQICLCILRRPSLRGWFRRYAIVCCRGRLASDDGGLGEHGVSIREKVAKEKKKRGGKKKEP
jgi:hypothetical protein